LKDYRQGALPHQAFYFQVSLGLAANSQREFWDLGGEFGGGGRRWMAGLFYRLRSPLGDASKSELSHLLGLDTSVLFYPAKRISMLEPQSILALGIPMAREFNGDSRQTELGLSLAYYYARGISVVLPSWGFGVRVLRGTELETWNASLDFHLPLWTVTRGLERAVHGMKQALP